MCPMDTEDEHATLHTLQAAAQHCESRLLDPPEPQMCQSSAGTDAGGDIQGASESRVAPGGLEDRGAMTEATPQCPARLCPTGHFYAGSAPLQRPNGHDQPRCGGGTGEDTRTAPAQTVRSW